MPYSGAMVYNESALHSMSCIVLAGAISSFRAGVTFELGARSQALVALVSTRCIESISDITALQRVQQLPYLVAMVYNESALHSMSCIIVLAGAWFATKVISMQCIARVLQLCCP